MKTENRNAVVLFSLLLGIIGLLLIFLVGQNKKADDPFTLGDYSATDIQSLLAIDQVSMSNDDLILLLSALSYKAKVQNDLSVVPMIKRYREELYDRAKRDEIDLQTADSEERMLELLRWINYYTGQ